MIDGCPLPDKPSPWQRGVVELVRPIQRVLEWPVAWIRPTLRVAQQWTLFQAAGRERFRMWIEGQRADRTWQILYRAGDAEHAEDAEPLQYRRVRGGWDPTDTAPGQYHGFAGWITARVLERHPELVAARVRMEKIEITAHGFDATDNFVLAHVRTRDTR